VKGRRWRKSKVAFPSSLTCAAQKFAHRLKSVAAKQNLLKQAEKLEGTSPDVPKFFGSAGALPSRKTIR
jgi:hypothetical protein